MCSPRLLAKGLPYSFPFPEQVFFGGTLQARQAANWYAMDSTIINTLLLASVRLGFTRLLRMGSIRAVTRWLFQMLSRLPGGTNDVCALAEVQGPECTWCVSLTSHQESRTTALCALPMIQALYEQHVKQPGVWLPEQVTDPTAYLQTLSDLGLEVQTFSKEEKGKSIL